MVIGHLVGSALIASAAGLWATDTPKNRIKKVLTASFDAHNMGVKEGKIKIRKIEKAEYGYYVELRLPMGYTVEQFEGKLPALVQDMYATIRMKHLIGRDVSLEISKKPMGTMVRYKDAPKKGLRIPVLTDFGWKSIDMEDDSSCHLLGGGATRMGKTVFLRLFALHMFLQNKGKARIIIVSSKTSDYFMFENLPNVTVCDTNEALEYLEETVSDYKLRKMYIKNKGGVNDARTLREHYPEDAFTPTFVIIDEYGSFSTKTTDKELKKYNEEIQQAVTELAERSGFVDIHLVIFAQRPDAKDVLEPRIKTNLLTKICFTTANEYDSRITLGIEDAAYLGAIKGRAVLIDGMKETVQVPYVSNEEAVAFLKPYYKKKDGNNHDAKGQENPKPADALPSFVAGPVGGAELPGRKPSVRNRKQNHEKAV